MFVRHFCVAVLSGWCLVCLLVCSSAQLAAEQPAPAAVSGRELKIMTFNAENMTAPNVRVRLERYRWEPARLAHIERVASIIEAQNPDIVNLLEVTSKEAVDLLVKILHEKGLTDYQGHHIDSSDSFTNFDVAVITKFPLDEIAGKTIRHFGALEEHPYKNSYYAKDETGTVRQRETGISRHSLYYLTAHGHKLGFLGLHLKAIPDDPASNAQRTNEMEIAQRIIRDEIVKRGYQPIVLGDMNDYDPDVPDRDEERSTMTGVLKGLKDFDPDQPGDELGNVAEKIVRQVDRYTNIWDRNENGVSDPGDVLTMIDHILLPKSLMEHIRRAYIFHATDSKTSDHWPVVVELQLPASK
jgi:endonuclease/exonuclease/phosphatase family metal-dependent hydrolase